MTDALPGTRASDESSCDYCGDDCTMVASEVSEFDADDSEAQDSEVPVVEEWEQKLEQAYRAAVDEERVGMFGPAYLNLRGWSPTPKE